jgi:anti-anti-sigma regulatory factor
VNTLAPLWTGLQVRTCPALNRTHLTVYGAVDEERLIEIRHAIADALARGHRVTFDFDSVTMVAQTALGELLALAEESGQP